MERLKWGQDREQEAVPGRLIRRSMGSPVLVAILSKLSPMPSPSLEHPFLSSHPSDFEFATLCHTLLNPAPLESRVFCESVFQCLVSDKRGLERQLSSTSSFARGHLLKFHLL